MSTLALMRFLEGSPDRYDAGMRWLTLGRVDAIRAALVAAVPEEKRVLEIGCGTGALTALLLDRGARVTALEPQAALLDRARQRIGGGEEGERIEWLDRSAAEIDGLAPESFEAVVAAFSFSEMSPGERRFVLRAARDRLRPRGVLAIADEVLPRGGVGRLLYRCLRGPQALAGWLLAGSVSRAIPDLRGEIESAGFEEACEARWLAESLALVVARRPAS